MWELAGLVFIVIIVIVMAQISISNSYDWLPDWQREYKDKHTGDSKK